MGLPLWQYLNIRSAISPAVSPDGSQVAFVSNITGIWQVFLMSADGGWPDQLTFFNSGATSVSWRPDGRFLVVGADQDGNERTQLFLITPTGVIVARLTDEPAVIHSFGGWANSGRAICFASNSRDVRFFDVYTMAIDETGARGLVERVWQDDAHWNVAGFRYDDRALLLSRMNASLDGDLFTLDLQSHELRHLTPHEGSARFSAASWAAQSDNVFALTDICGRNYVNLAEVNASTGEITWLSEGAADYDGLKVSKDGRILYYSVNREGYSEPHFLDLERGNEIVAPELAAGVIGEVSFSADGSVFALAHNSPTRPFDCYVGRTGVASARQLTRSAMAGIPSGSLVNPRLVHFSSFDGLEISGFLYAPSGGGSLRPAVVHVHGGPESQERPNFNAIYQYLLSNGYAVFAPNIRGSLGYGAEFTHLDDGRKRWDALKDIVACADWLKASGLVDPDKIAIMGGSYGGFATLASLAHHPDVWAAGVDIVGISHFGTFLRNTGPWRVKLRASEYGDPDLDADFFEDISPLNHAERIRCPLMVVQGANDPRVPKSEADQMVERIRRIGGRVEYLVFDDEGHGVAKLQNRIRCYEAIVEFLDSVLLI